MIPLHTIAVAIDRLLLGIIDWLAADCYFGRIYLLTRYNCLFLFEDLNVLKWDFDHFTI